VLVGTKSAALLQHGVDQRGLAVVHVRDDGDIANAQTQSMSFIWRRIDGSTQPSLGRNRPMYNFTMGGDFSGDYIALTCKYRQARNQLHLADGAE
jgi:hypothetical protein